MSQNTSSAVMQQRAARIVEADDAKRALWRKLDFFPTPPWAARAGADMVRQLDPEACSALEPACGEGHIAEPARAYFEKLWATDIHHYGCNVQQEIDFLQPGQMEAYFGHPDDHPDWIITNPPFLKAAEFVTRGLEVARRGVAVLCRAAFLESAGRFDLLFMGPNPLRVMSPFIERVPMQLGVWDPRGSTATAYAWFFFEKGGVVEGPKGRKPPVIIPMPPGTKTNFTRPDDAARFGGKIAVPLFDGETDHE